MLTQLSYGLKYVWPTSAFWQRYFLLGARGSERSSWFCSTPRSSIKLIEFVLYYKSCIVVVPNILESYELLSILHEIKCWKYDQTVYGHPISKWADRSPELTFFNIFWHVYPDHWHSCRNRHILKQMTISVTNYF